MVANKNIFDVDIYNRLVIINCNIGLNQMHRIVIHHENFIMLVFAVGSMKPSSNNIYEWLVENIGDVGSGWDLGTAVSGGGIIIFDDDTAMAFKLVFSDYIVNK